MPAIQNQQTSLSYLLKLGGEEITEHNRKIDISTNQSGSDVELARGITKRYVKKNKKTFSISFTYLPNTHERTVDGRKARDYILNLFRQKSVVELKIKLEPQNDYQTYTCYFNSYSEVIKRRDIENSCTYYDLTIELGEQ